MAVSAVPDCEDPILSLSVVPFIFKKLSKLDPIELIAIDEVAPLVEEVML